MYFFGHKYRLHVHNLSRAFDLVSYCLLNWFYGILVDSPFRALQSQNCS